jgi:hypothetical protein
MLAQSEGIVGDATGAEGDAAAGCDGELVGGEGGGFGLDDADFAVKIVLAGGGFAGGSFDAKSGAGLAEAAIFESADASEDQGKGCGPVSAMVEGARGLHHGFEHHDTGQDGKAGEVVEQVFLGIRDVLDGDEVIWGDFEHAIDQGEMHGQSEGRKGAQSNGEVRVAMGRGAGRWAVTVG